MLEYLKNVPISILLSISIVITVIGDFFAKKWSIYPDRLILWYVGMILWMIANIFFFPSLLKKTLIVAGLIFTVGNALGYVLVGTLFFKETLNFNQIAGIFLGCVAIILLNLD